MLSRFFASGESGIHISLKAEPVTQLGPLTVTNSMIYGVICAVIIGAILIWSSRKIKINGQKGFSQIPEMMVDFVIGLLEGPLGSRKNAVKYAPIFGTYFLFIIFTNLLALLPIVGPGLTVSTAEGSIPLLRPFTADLNATIAMSVIAILMVQILSIKEQGGKKHLQHYFSDKPWNPISFFIGILEVFGEFTRMLSLSLRLFLNTAVGEILVAVFTSMIAAGGRTPLAVLPILLFEMLVAGIQAYVFTILCATYLGLAISHAHEDHDDDHQPADIPKEVESRGMHGG
jgi:F-type H+-transporting ATPase subunit a